MKNQNIMSSLTFNKVAVTELNDNALTNINGGSTFIGGETCTGCCCLEVSINKTVVDNLLQ